MQNDYSIMCLEHMQNIFEIQAQWSQARSDFLFISKVSNGRQNYPKTIQYRQRINSCGHSDHQLNMGMFIKDTIVKRNYYYRICSKVTVNLLISCMSCICQNWACTGLIVSGNIGSALSWFWYIKACFHGWYHPGLLSFLSMIPMKASVLEPGRYWPDAARIGSVLFRFWHIKERLQGWHYPRLWCFLVVLHIKSTTILYPMLNHK